MSHVRNFERILVWGRSADRAQMFVRRHPELLRQKMRVVESVRHAVREADVVCATTATVEPIIEGKWLRPGMHVNLVGSSDAAHREMDADGVARSRFYCDLKESALQQCGEFIAARDSGLVDDSHIVGELGGVICGHVPGRENSSQITIFKSLGIVVEDLLSAHHVLKNAKRRSLGTLMDFG